MTVGSAASRQNLNVYSKVGDDGPRMCRYIPGGLFTIPGISCHRDRGYNAYTNVKGTIINLATTEESLARDDWFRHDLKEVRYGSVEKSTALITLGLP